MRRFNLVVLAMIAASTALADDATRVIDTITVEAAKRPLQTSAMPARVTLIDATRVEKELAQSIEDLVRYEPGIDVVNQGSRFGLSGISIRGVGGNRVQIEVDGVATSDAFSIGSFSNASRDFFDVDSLKQVEIIRGPASAVFGSDALGGVVSFVTKGPSDLLRDDDQYVDLSAGFNSVDASQVLSGTFASRFGAVAGMLRVTQRSGEERNIAAADPLQDDSLNVLARFDVGDVSDGGLSLSLERFAADSQTQVNSLERVQDFTAAFGFPFVIDTSEVAGDDSRERTRVSVGQEWLGGVVGIDYLRWRAYQQDSNTTQNTLEVRETFIAGTPGAQQRNREFLFEQTLVGAELNAGSDFSWGNSNHELSYGAELERAETEQLRDGIERNLITGDVSNQVGPDLFPLRDFPLSETRRMGVYLQDRITIGSVTLTPGVRWDRYELAPQQDAIFAEDNPGITPAEYDDDQVSPKFGALWQVNDMWQVYAQYSEGFRAPPVNDVNVGFTNFQFGYTALPNPDLESESSQGYELGVRFGANTLRFDVAAFHTRYDDFIQSFQVVGFDPVNQLTIFQSVNVDEVTIDGAEATFAWSPAALPEGWRFNLSAAYARGEDQITGQPINSVAPLNAVFGVDFAAPQGRWGVTGLVRSAAGQDRLDETDGELLSPAGYAVIDTIAFWKLSDKLRLRAGVYNLADRDFTAYLDVQGIAADNPNAARLQRPGREASIAIDWVF
ncbi:MAG: TonB-dependent hemoglobin/transferrin/lactoferrin family receptor [Pseudomonadota bacterium]